MRVSHINYISSRVPLITGIISLLCVSCYTTLLYAQFQNRLESVEKTLNRIESRVKDGYFVCVPENEKGVID